ncbi:MAG: hypothetical protein Q9163_001860 [Psora crenata]
MPSTRPEDEVKADDPPRGRSPPTPPPLPNWQEKNAKVSRFVLKLRSAPPGYYFDSPTTAPRDFNAAQTGPYLEGAAYEVASTEDGEKLAYYETNNYTGGEMQAGRAS